MTDCTLHNVYNVPLSCSFWDVIADIYVNRYQENYLKLASALFLLPNRRACQMLIAAFVRRQGIRPAILPQIVPLTEIDDDELFFDNASLTDVLLGNKAPINTSERLFLFTRMIMSKPDDFGLKQLSLAQAFNLASDLACLIDTASNLGLSFDKLYDLVPEKYATHWQETLKLLKIITDFWPKILEERNAVDACDFKKSLLYKQAELWQKNKENRPIIAAGITASFPAVVNLLQTVKNLNQGEIYFAGIDFWADDVYWNAIDESHPQFELKQLLSLLQIDRKQITPICKAQDIGREKFISELMRPAVVSYAWRNIDKSFDISQILDDIQILECQTQREEALAIALKMREVLNFPEKTVALVTYDRNLARRVASELERFDIKVDDSAGIPLSLTPVGIFLRLIAESAQDLDSDTKFITLLKHPFMLFNQSPANFRKNVYTYELSLRQKSASLDEDLSLFVTSIKDELAILQKQLFEPSVEFEDILKVHIQLAEKLATSDENDGSKILWKGNDGKKAASFITKILESAKTLGKINGADYLSLFCELMSMESVRSNYGTHPRLSILGPIEARLCHFDYMILGELSEGIWPKAEKADMWMSRPMKKDFGFTLPEKNTGILAADLCVFLASQHVIITRAERIDGVPMKKSRWLLRLETVLNALNSDITFMHQDDFMSFVSNLDKPQTYISLLPPNPTPPIEARPRKLSASAVDLLVADPYSVFAKYILKLYPLDDLDIPLDQRDYGTLIHGIIEEFNNTYPSLLPSSALDILLDIGKRHFSEAHIEPELQAFWWPKFVTTVRTYLVLDNRENINFINNEVSGEIVYHLPKGDVTFTAKADRIDILKDGKINIIDYKTGKIPNKNQVQSGHALQLPLEGLIATKGHFSNIKNNDVNKLIYWQLGNDNLSKSTLSFGINDDNLLEKSEEYLLKLMNTFDMETTPYYARPIPKYVSKNIDYVHLARVKEWSVQEEEDSNGE